MQVRRGACASQKADAIPSLQAQMQTSRKAQARMTPAQPPPAKAGSTDASPACAGEAERPSLACITVAGWNRIGRRTLGRDH